MIRRESLSQMLTPRELCSVDRSIACRFENMEAAITSAINVSRLMGCEDIAVYWRADEGWRIGTAATIPEELDSAIVCFIAAPTRKVA